MSDNKISALNSITSLNSSDVMYIVQGGVSMKTDVGTFAKNLPAFPISQEPSETVLSGGLSRTLLVSKITTAATPITYTLTTGSHGSEKIIVCSTVIAGSSNVIVSSGIGFSNILFTLVGQSAHLKNIDGGWYIIGSNGVIIT